MLLDAFTVSPLYEQVILLFELRWLRHFLVINVDYFVEHESRVLEDALLRGFSLLLGKLHTERDERFLVVLELSKAQFNLVFIARRQVHE